MHTLENQNPIRELLQQFRKDQKTITSYVIHTTPKFNYKQSTNVKHAHSI